jgi:aspartyl protease family protein
MMRILTLVVVLTASHFSPQVQADVEVLGLFRDAAYLKVNGREKLVKVGASFQGVEVLAADAKKARIRYRGREQVVTVSQHISSAYSEVEQRVVRIRSNNNHQYVTRVTINGRAVEVIVDTGANVVAMNSGTAQALGLQYRDNRPHVVSTASGQVMAHPVTLDSVVLGGIRVNHVRATVLEGDFPTQVLLGMSYLQHVEMSEKGGVLMLLQRY